MFVWTQVLIQKQYSQFYSLSLSKKFFGTEQAQGNYYISEDKYVQQKWSDDDMKSPQNSNKVNSSLSSSTKRKKCFETFYAP